MWSLFLQWKANQNHPESHKPMSNMSIYDQWSEAQPFWPQLEETCQGDLWGETWEEEEGGAAQTYITSCVAAHSVSAAIYVIDDLSQLTFNKHLSFDCRFISTDVVHRPIQIVIQPLNQLRRRLCVNLGGSKKHSVKQYLLWSLVNQNFGSLFLYCCEIASFVGLYNFT